MKKLEITGDTISYKKLDNTEVIELEIYAENNALEESLQPSKEEVEDAEFELKLITKLSEWGVI